MQQYKDVYRSSKKIQRSIMILKCWKSEDCTEIISLNLPVLNISQYETHSEINQMYTQNET